MRFNLPLLLSSFSLVAVLVSAVPAGSLRSSVTARSIQGRHYDPRSYYPHVRKRFITSKDSYGDSDWDEYHSHLSPRGPTDPPEKPTAQRARKNSISSKLASALQIGGSKRKSSVPPIDPANRDLTPTDPFGNPNNFEWDGKRKGSLPPLPPFMPLGQDSKSEKEKHTETNAPLTDTNPSTRPRKKSVSSIRSGSQSGGARTRKTSISGNPSRLIHGSLPRIRTGSTTPPPPVPPLPPFVSQSPMYGNVILPPGKSSLTRSKATVRRKTVSDAAPPPGGAQR
ncbi:hypothetical protein C8Q75DRAFT_802827 [Abortiporus biennis]|nr:hypothetical protein C8Q75DRAFT_802827 [Abortiporus biennis]